MSIATLTPPASTLELGNLQFVPVSQLVVIAAIQRIAPDARLRKMAREWDDRKVSHLKVGRITDGPNAGVLHVYDGGTRALCRGADLIYQSGLRRNLADRLPEGAVDPNYLFRCVITSMTEREAAAHFGACNGDAKKPAVLDHYRVSLKEGAIDALAVHHALSSVGVVADVTVASYGTADRPGNVGAIAAVYRIINEGRRAARVAGIDDAAEQWEVGAYHVADTLRITRAAYHGPEAHDADLIQAVARLLRMNPVFNDPTDKRRDKWRQRLIATIAAQPVSAWRASSTMERDQAASFAGSTSRSNHMARCIARRANAGQRANQRFIIDTP